MTISTIIQFPIEVIQLCFEFLPPEEVRYSTRFICQRFAKAFQLTQQERLDLKIRLILGNVDLYLALPEFTKIEFKRLHKKYLSGKIPYCLFKSPIMRYGSNFLLLNTFKKSPKHKKQFMVQGFFKTADGDWIAYGDPIVPVSDEDSREHLSFRGKLNVGKAKDLGYEIQKIQQHNSKKINPRSLCSQQ